MLTSVLERIRDGVIALDREWRYTYVNPQAAHMLGRAHPNDLIGKIALEEFPDAMERSWGRAYAKAMETQEPSLLEAHNVAMDRWFLSRIYPSADGLTVVISEITQQKRTERRLRDAEARLQRAVSAGNVGLFDFNIVTNEVFFSPQWKKQLGYEDHEISNHHLEWESRLHPDDRQPSLDAVAAYLANPTTTVYDRQFRLRHKDGSYRWILSRAGLIEDESGGKHLLGSHVDVTDRVTIEKQLQRAQRMESVGRLAGGIAHDFNNALTVINNYADLMVEGLAAHPELFDRALVIRRAGGKAAQLTQQLLAFSRQQALKPINLNLLVILEEMAPMLRRLIGENIQLSVIGDPDVSSVNADPGQIDQVIMNLTLNARDAMPDGGTLRITVSNCRLDESHGDERVRIEPGPYVELKVTDDGTGMPENVRDLIFEPFFTTKELGHGTGLGMPTVYGIIKQSGGYIWVDSSEGHGTTVRILLPAVKGKPEANHTAGGSGPPRGTESVLIVEDDNDVRVLTALMLSAAGYSVTTARSGEEGLAILESAKEPVDMVLTDLVMPGMNGRRFAEHVMERWPKARLLYMSGYIEDQDRIISPGEHFIGKPFTRSNLLRKVRDVLDD